MDWNRCFKLKVNVSRFIFEGEKRENKSYFINKKKHPNKDFQLDEHKNKIKFKKNI